MDRTAILKPKVPSAMNHLPEPHAPVHPPVEVECLVAEEYDGGPFLEYPSRRGWTTAEVNFPPVSKRSVDDIASFFQTWLWFGLLSEFLQRPVHSLDFVVETEDGKRLLTTQNLKGAIAKWIVREKAFSVGTKGKRAAHFDAVLGRVYTIFSFWGQGGEYNPFQDPWMGISIIILCEALDLAFEEVHRTTTLNRNTPWSRLDRGWPLDGVNVISQRMIKDGWCPSAIRRLSGNQTQGGRYFISRMQRPSPEVKHDKCTRMVCRGHDVPLQSYKTKHRENGCACGFVYADNARVVAILLEGRIPVVHFTEEHGLNVVEANPDAEKYIAISHVWSDGLGNQNGNGLPRCQLQHLSSLVAPHTENRALFWIDTLCCPKSPKEAKNQAIALMRETYQQAHKVLVLDSYFKNHTLEEMSQIEAFAMIYNSGWNRRLWTLEEGVLAKSNLQFQFNGATMNAHDTLMEALAEDWKKLILSPYEYPMDDFVADGFSLGIRSIYTNNLYKLGDPKAPLRDKLLLLEREMRDRQTTDLADEPVCLANLLNLDVKVILESPKEKRMEIFWSLMHDIPSDLVFWMRDRLDTPGYRWAPSTLLGGLGFLGESAEAVNYGVVGKGHGLYTTFPGWTLGCSPGQHIQVFFRFVEGTEHAYSVTCETKQLFDATAAYFGPDKLDRVALTDALANKFINPWEMVNIPPTSETELAIITKTNIRRSHFVEEYNAALVVITQFKGNVRYVRKVCHASVKKQDMGWIGPMATNTLNSIRQRFPDPRTRPPKWCAGNNEGDVAYSDFMSGVPTDGEVFWCVD